MVEIPDFPKPTVQPFAALKGKKIALVVDESEIDRPGGLPERLKKECPGKKLLIYQPPEEGEKRGQLIERDVNEDQLPSAFSFLLGNGKLDEDFEVRLLEHDNESFQDGYVLQLVPRRPTPNYEQLVFYVRTLTHGGKRAGVVQRVLIIDSAGNRNRFDFAKIKFNRDVPNKRFSYRPPKGTDRVKP